MKKFRSTVERFASIIYPCVFFALLILIWQIICSVGAVPSYLLPKPGAVLRAFISDFPALARHTGGTLFEAFSGLLISLAVSFVLAVALDSLEPVKKAVYPALVVTQTIPAIAVAPLLTLWLGYSYAPKIALVIITCFFPLTVGLLDGFRSADGDMMNLMRALGANRRQSFFHVKLQMAMPSFFAGLKIAVSYAVVGAVISEWLGGTKGLGVYMTRVRKSYSYDKMFAVIILVSLISILLIALLKIIEKRVMPYLYLQKNK